jgi:hypothetical protein
VTFSVVVFVVEDDELIGPLLEEALTDRGFVVVIATDSERMRRHAREINDKLPVIYITGDSGHDWGSKGVPNSQLLPKPFAMAQVVTAVSHLINAG